MGRPGHVDQIKGLGHVDQKWYTKTGALLGQRPADRKLPGLKQPGSGHKAQRTFGQGSTLSLRSRLKSRDWVTWETMSDQSDLKDKTVSCTRSKQVLHVSGGELVKTS